LVSDLISTIKNKFFSLRDELKSVDWPDKPKVLSATYAVVAVSMFVGFFLWGSDWLISWGMQYLFPHQ